MTSFDLLDMCLRNLTRRKSRTILTVIGVVIGTASIILMLSLGIALDSGFQEDLGKMGNLQVIEVYPMAPEGQGNSSMRIQQTKLDDNTVQKIEQIPGVEAVMAVKNTYMKVGAGKMVGSLQIIGVEPEVLKSFDYQTTSGRLLTATDKDAIVFGARANNNFYNPRHPNANPGFFPAMGSGEGPVVKFLDNKLILTANMEYGERRRSSSTEDSKTKLPPLHEVKGVGILKEANDERDFSAYMNITALKKIMEEDSRATHEPGQRTNRGEQGYQNVKVKVKNMDQVQAVQDQIKALGFQTYSLIDMLNSMKKTSRTIQGVLGGIGAVSLLVAAIGITNTMVMSIYERTREIGIMKVIGACISDIKKLFLIEASMIGFGGGLIGTGLSYGLSFTLNHLVGGMMGGFLGGGGPQRPISIIPFELALGAIAFATLVGVISGYAPAKRAMNLSALAAIRSE